MQLISNWLNGKQDYWTGVFLYKKYGSSEAFKTLFSTGASSFNKAKLVAELQKLCPSTTSQTTLTPKLIATPVVAAIAKKDYSDTELYKVCIDKAKMLYKQVMNQRAVLFSTVDIEDFEGDNTPDKIAKRQPICKEIVIGFREVSKLYDDAAYVKEHGVLPYNGNEDVEDAFNVDNVSDENVYRTLCNARKNYNKMKDREATPERVQMLQIRKDFITKLEARWQLLKQKLKN